MKLLCFVLLLPFLGLAQSQEKEFIQQLEKDRFISKFEAYRVSPDSVIESLYDVYLARLGYSRTQRDLLPSSWSYYSTEEDPALKQRKLLLKHLREFGIIPKEICADLYKKTTFESNIKPTNGSSSIPSNVIIRSELEILQYLYEWRLLQKQKSLLPNYILKLDSLGFIKNIKSVDFSTINGHDDILKYFKHHIVIKEEELPDSYGDAYKYAYEKLLLLDSTFMITDFKYSYEEKKRNTILQKSIGLVLNIKAKQSCKAIGITIRILNMISMNR